MPTVADITSALDAFAPPALAADWDNTGLLLGEYRECSFRLAGTGTFHGGEGANPAVGQKGRREEVSEWRLEVVCPESAVEAVISAMRRAHSYEEPAYDVYTLNPGRSPVGE